MYDKKGYDCFHFDNLETIDEIINHWQYLETCLKKYLVEIRKNSFPDNEFQIKLLMLISLLAQTLHAVQDFYCHTNWVEILHEKNSYEKTSDFPTWFDLIEKDQNLKKELPTLQSGYFPIGKDNKKHLIYHNDRKRKNLPGLNKDRADRPYFEIVYSLAKRHGVQWLNYIKTNFLTTEELNLLNKPLSIPFANEINKIHDYGYSIAYKLKEWNGSRPFNNLCLKINDAQVKGSKLKLDLIVTTTDKLIKYDRDFRKAYIIIELIINGYKQRYFKFCNKNGSVKVIIEMKTNNLQKEVHQLIIQVKYGLLKTSKLIIGEY